MLSELDQARSHKCLLRTQCPNPPKWGKHVGAQSLLMLALLVPVTELIREPNPGHR